MKNKRGFLQLLTLPIIIALLIFAILVIGGFLVFASFNLLPIVGGAMIILAIIFGLKGKFTKGKGVFLAFIVIAGLVLLLAGATLQNTLAVSNYEDNSGNTHWLVNAVATGVDEGYTFRSLPSQTVNTEGETIKPSEEATLFISKAESYCEYQLNKVEKSKNLGLTKLNYYELKAPERVSLIKVRDNFGTEKIIDGTITRTETFYNNGGELKFTTVGILASKQDCQEGSNVAIIYGSNGEIGIKDRGELENFFNRLSIFRGILTLIDLPTVRDNTAFLSNFEDYSVRGTERFIGDVEIGNVEFTIDADQNYYNSVVVTPEKSAKPRISSIEIQSDIKVDTTSGVILKISNNGPKGGIIIDASTEFGDISPTSKNAILEDTLSSVFTLKVPNLETNNKEVCFTVSSTDGQNSDTDCESFSVSKKADDKCGNGVCESFESFTTCPSDCEKSTECEIDSDCSAGLSCIDGKCKSLLECGFGQQLSTKTKSVGKGPLGIGKLVGLTEEVTTEKCVTAGWVIWVVLGIVILALGITAIMVNKPKKRGKK